MSFKIFFLKLIGYQKPTIRQMIFRRIEIFYDSLYGLDFLSVISNKTLGLNEELVSKGSPSGNRYLYNVLKSLNIQKEDSILDIGSAKGSAMKYFTMFPFKNIHGLELSEKLVKICTNNFKILKKNNVKVFNKSAIDFQKYNDYNFFYLYNPFPESVMIKFLDLLTSQIKYKEIIIIYNNPVCHNNLLDSGFNLLKTYPDMWGNGINIYSSLKKTNKINLCLN
tara:strand:+ start:6333 stop:7001 length:669 start_codon:yes stop_codon:yes gene_type:complete